MIRALFTMCLIYLFSSVAHARSILSLTTDEMAEVVRVARAISLVQPFLSESKYIEHAISIYRASSRYGIEPAILIAIAQQESAFRESLPEGPAGELGICQILKSWMNNPRFRQEFPKTQRRDFMRPSQSFLFAAWILKQLKNDRSSYTLPYWSYYNSVRFSNRVKYFHFVNRYVSLLRRYQLYLTDSALKLNPQQVREIMILRERAKTAQKTSPWPSLAYWAPTAIPSRD